LARGGGGGGGDSQVHLVLQKISQIGIDLLEADRFSLYLYDKHSRELWTTIISETGGECQILRVQVGKGIAGSVAATGEAVCCRDAYDLACFGGRNVDKRTNFRTKSVLCVPVFAQLATHHGQQQPHMPSSSGEKAVAAAASGSGAASTPHAKPQQGPLIAVMQALNKRVQQPSGSCDIGEFSDIDREHMQQLARQVRLVVSALHFEANIVKVIFDKTSNDLQGFEDECGHATHRLGRAKSLASGTPLVPPPVKPQPGGGGAAAADNGYVASAGGGAAAAALAMTRQPLAGASVGARPSSSSSPPTFAATTLSSSGVHTAISAHEENVEGDEAAVSLHRGKLSQAAPLPNARRRGSARGSLRSSLRGSDTSSLGLGPVPLEEVRGATACRAPTTSRVDVACSFRFLTGDPTLGCGRRAALDEDGHFSFAVIADGEEEGGDHFAGDVGGQKTHDIAAELLHDKTCMKSLSRAGMATVGEYGEGGHGEHDESGGNGGDVVYLPEWNFCVVSAHRNHTRLLAVIERVFRNQRLVDTALGVPRARLLAFAGEVMLHYKDNPYHNFTHAVQVLWSTHVLLHGEAGARLGPQTRLALLISALCHDLDHPGHTNGFEIATGSDLAMLYSDDSVLERHHAALTFHLMRARPSSGSDFSPTGTTLAAPTGGGGGGGSLLTLDEMMHGKQSPSPTPSLNGDAGARSVFAGMRPPGGGGATGGSGGPLDVLQGFSPAGFAHARRVIVSAILGTCMTRHGKKCSELHQVSNRVCAREALVRTIAPLTAPPTTLE
jgi:hypothetical protein